MARHLRVLTAEDEATEKAYRRRRYEVRQERADARKHPVAAKVEPIRKMSRRALKLGEKLWPKESDPLRPVVRGDCAGAPRPCVYVTCRWNLYLDVHPVNGSIRFTFPDIEPGEMKESCALDVADRGGVNLDDAGVYCNLTRQRVQQLEAQALGALGDNEALVLLASELSR